MLRRLVIRDYLLVRQAELTLEPGLTVLTGETGAGKSMVVGALDVLLGERFPPDVTAHGAERTVVEGVFQIDPQRLRQVLPDDEAPENEVILRREITRQGRSRSWLNDHPLPLSQLQKLRAALADFHGQREHQTLFDPLQQLIYLDVFAGCTAEAAAVAEQAATRAAQKKECQRLQAELTAHRKDRALLEYQLEEIERLGLRAGEEESVVARLKKLESAERLAEETGRLCALLIESDTSLVTVAGQAKLLATAITRTDPELNPVADELAVVSSQLKDLGEQVRRYRDALHVDESELQRLRDRRSLLWELRRKHGQTLDEILSRSAEMKDLLKRGRQLEETCREREAELAATGERLVAAALRLSRARHKAAPEFSSRVLDALKPLGFPDPRFAAVLTSADEPFDPELISPQGADQVDFVFSANPGIPPLPIHRVASGGESSRVTLAIKSVLAGALDYPLMVYDEIDLGISGRVADQVGAALAKLAERHQVIVITHLPQIAARADRHLAVRKRTRSGATETTVEALSAEQRVEELAGLLAGPAITEKSRASAGEMLRQNDKPKKPTRSLG